MKLKIKKMELQIKMIKRMIIITINRITIKIFKDNFFFIILPLVVWLIFFFQAIILFIYTFIKKDGYVFTFFIENKEFDRSNYR